MAARIRIRVTNTTTRPLDIAGRYIQPGQYDTFDFEQVPPEWRAGAAVVSSDDGESGELVREADSWFVRKSDGSAASLVECATAADGASVLSADGAEIVEIPAGGALVVCETGQDGAVALKAGAATLTSATPAAGKIPLAGDDGHIDPGWLFRANDIGTPGQLGFGVGICPSPPVSYSPMEGTTIVGHDNHGNYTNWDGSVEVWVPQCWFKVGMGVGANGLDIDQVDVKPAHYFATEAHANAAGYMSHRADWDAGALQPGQFVDKYACSANGAVASSIKDAMPMVSGPAAGQVGFSAVGAANAYYGAIAAAKTRSANHFACSRFIYAKLALLSLAHGQAATSTTNCAWYDAAGVINFPKGCNNNALKDTNDTSVTYTTADASSYPSMPLAGSGAPFAKTTHNGQPCGIADLNGGIWEISLGITCITVAKTITAATQASPVQITAATHGFETGDIIMITGAGGMTQLNDKMYRITVTDADVFTLDGCDGTAFAAFTTGGTATMGRWYAAKKTARMADYTAGTTLATDHWGATGVAATMERIYPEFRLDYPNNGFSQRFGNAAGQVLSGATSGNDWLLTGLGLPQDTGVSTAGASRFGQDYFYQYCRNELCVISGANWYLTSTAGVWAASLSNYRTDALSSAGLRAASYLAS